MNHAHDFTEGITAEGGPEEARSEGGNSKYDSCEARLQADAQARSCHEYHPRRAGADSGGVSYSVLYENRIRA